MISWTLNGFLSKMPMYLKNVFLSKNCYFFGKKKHSNIPLYNYKFGKIQKQQFKEKSKVNNDTSINKYLLKLNL